MSIPIDLSTSVSACQGTAAQWVATNTPIDSGVFCYETDTKLLKIGDGSTLYKNLPYVNQNVTTQNNNLILGGDFSTNPWQRGTSFTNVGATAVTYTVDRWPLSVNAIGSGLFNIAQAADAPTILQSGVATNHSLKITVGTAATSLTSSSYALIRQEIEAYDWGQLGYGQSGAQSITVSFWVKSTIAGIYSVNITTSSGSRTCPINFTINNVNVWEKKVIVIPGDTTGTWLVGSSAYAAMLQFVLHAGATYQGTSGTWSSNNNVGTSSNSNNFITTTGATFQLALIKLEPGSSATPFNALSFYEVMMKCKRYYHRLSGRLLGAYPTSTNSWVSWIFPVMRTTPVFTAGSGSQYNSVDNVTSDNVTVTSNSGGNVVCIGAGSTVSAE